jgi:hypothetical protein
VDDIILQAIEKFEKADLKGIPELELLRLFKIGSRAEVVLYTELMRIVHTSANVHFPKGHPDRYDAISLAKINLKLALLKADPSRDKEVYGLIKGYVEGAFKDAKKPDGYDINKIEARKVYMIAKDAKKLASDLRKSVEKDGIENAEKKVAGLARFLKKSAIDTDIEYLRCDLVKYYNLLLNLYSVKARMELFDLLQILINRMSYHVKVIETHGVIDSGLDDKLTDGEEIPSEKEFTGKETSEGSGSPKKIIIDDDGVSTNQNESGDEIIDKGELGKIEYIFDAEELVLVKKEAKEKKKAKEMTLRALFSIEREYYIMLIVVYMFGHSQRLASKIIGKSDSYISEQMANAKAACSEAYKKIEKDEIGD